MSKRKQPKPTKTLYQLKIKLMGSKPPIWRRILVVDCTLDELHMHIQTAMDWTNSHLHQFEFKGVQFGHPIMLGDELFEDGNFKDSTVTLLSDIIPDDGTQFSFRYEYDFGNAWLHEVLFEGCPKPEQGQKYPLCLEGARACPPEDVGGLGGYYNYLDAISDPEHADHEMMMEWGGPFDATKFDAAEATKRMRKGLPDWDD